MTSNEQRGLDAGTPQVLMLVGHWSKHRLSDGVFLPLACYVPTGPDYTTVPLYARTALSSATPEKQP